MPQAQLKPRKTKPREEIGARVAITQPCGDVRARALAFHFTVLSDERWIDAQNQAAIPVRTCICAQPCPIRWLGQPHLTINKFAWFQ